MSYTKDELSKMTLTKLKEVCKESKISGCYKFKSANKHELVDLIIKSQKQKSPVSSSPLVISKTEIGKMTVKQLKELLKKCEQTTSGLKADLVDRVFNFCREGLSATRVSPKKTKALTVKELKDLLVKKNIKHYNTKLKKSDLEYLSKTKACNPENNDFCGDEEVCDIRDGICTKKEYLKGQTVEAMISGHKIVGDKELIDKLLNKAAKKLKRKTIRIRTPVVSRYPENAKNYFKNDTEYLHSHF
jgi:hypothetical protein